MPTFTVTYHSESPKSKMLQVVDYRCQQCDTSNDALASLCGAIANTSVFLIPEYELENKRRYSIENVCLYMPGLFSIGLNDLLEDLGYLALGSVKPELIRHVLDNCALYECLDAIGVNVRNVVYALLQCLLRFEGKSGLPDKSVFPTYAKLYSYYTSTYC